MAQFLSAAPWRCVALLKRPRPERAPQMGRACFAHMRCSMRAQAYDHRSTEEGRRRRGDAGGGGRCGDVRV